MLGFSSKPVSVTSSDAVELLLEILNRALPGDGDVPRRFQFPVQPLDDLIRLTAAHAQNLLTVPPVESNCP